MANTLNVYALPTLVAPEDLIEGVVVVIDVLRASTTIIHALQAGANEVIPCLEIDDAWAVAEQYPRDEVVLGGERNGLPIERFDLGNSPIDYTPFRVGGKTVVFTTTNGTRAIQRAHLAERVLIGAFANASAIVRELLEQTNVHLLCAGTDGQMSDDDILMAGMLVERITRQSGLLYELNVQALTAKETWLHRFALPRALGAEPLEPELLAKELRKSAGGKNLVAIGLDGDIFTASQIDQFDCVPELDPEKTRIRLV